MNTNLKQKRVVITPVFNEEENIVHILNQIITRTTFLIIINDGSTDSSKEKIEEWKRDKKGVFFISYDINQGASTALKKGYAFVRYLWQKGLIGPDDLIIEMDSDGQHDPLYIDVLSERFIKLENYDVVLGRRDFSNYPLYKKIGNKGLTIIASTLGGFKYKDVESNFRVTRTRVLVEILDYFIGYRYSGAFEFGIISGRLGHRIDNGSEIKVPLYRSGTNLWDGFHVLVTGIIACIKVLFKIRNRSIDEFCGLAVSEWTEYSRNKQGSL